MEYIHHALVFERCTSRHWCPDSEGYTGADSLVTAVYHGWQIVDCIVDRSHRCTSHQWVTVYAFTLRFDNEFVVMRVIANPYADHVYHKYQKTLAGRRIHKASRIAASV